MTSIARGRRKTSQSQFEDSIWQAACLKATKQSAQDYLKMCIFRILSNGQYYKSLTSENWCQRTVFLVLLIENTPFLQYCLKFVHNIHRETYLIPLVAVKVTTRLSSSKKWRPRAMGIMVRSCGSIRGSVWSTIICPTSSSCSRKH